MGAPKLRFKGFSDEWVINKMNEVSTKITDGTHDTPKPTVAGVPYLTALHIKDGWVDYKNCYYLPQQEHDKIYQRCNPEIGDLLLVNIGAGTATCAINSVDYPFSLKNVALIKPNRKLLNSLFLEQIQRKNSKKQFHQLTSGGAQPFLSLKEIGRFKLFLPSLSEQQKIADFLTSVDDKINLLKKKKELLEQYKKGVMQKIFSQELRFKDDEGKDFPAWEEKRLGDICEITKGKQLNVENMVEDGLFPALNGGVTYSGYTNSWNNEKDTITVSEGGNSCGFVSFIKEDFWCGGHCYALKNIKEGIIKIYLYQNLKQNELSIMRMRVGSGLPNIQKKALADFFVQVPDPKEQQKIADFLTALDDKIDLVEQQIDKTELWKKGLLQQMFV